MRAFRRSQPHFINPRFQCQLGHVTPDHAILLAVCIFMLSMLVMVAEHMQVAGRDHMNPVDQCCIYPRHKTFKHGALMLPSLNKILPAMVLQNGVVKSNIWCLSCYSSHASVYHVSSSPILSIPSGVGKVVVGAVVVLLLLMSGDIELNPGPFGNKLTLDDLVCVLEEILDVSPDWYDLGLQLKVRIGTLKSIRTEFGDPKHQLREMLNAWLTTGDNPSWRTLIDALRSRIVGASQLAAVLEAKYCQGTSTPPYPFSIIDKPTSPEPQAAAVITHSPLSPLCTQGPLYSPELKVLDLYFNKLVESISNPERLAFELHTRDLISLKVCDETMKITGPSTYSKASKLVAAVKDQIMTNPSVLHKFLSVVREDPSLVYIADAMSDNYRLLLPPRVADTSTPTLSQLSTELRDFKKHSNSRGEETSESSSTVDALKPRRIISREQRRIISYFTIVMDRITEILEAAVKLDKLLQFLRFYSHPLSPWMPYIDQCILQNARSVPEVIKCLVPEYIDYNNTGLLEAIIERFECKEAQTLLQQYHDHYPINQLLRGMPDPVSDEGLDLTRRKRLRVSCDGDFDSAIAADVERVHTHIKTATDIDRRFVTVFQHSEGGDYPISKFHRDMADPGNKLTLDDLVCVLEEILDVSPDWYDLGLQLKVRIGTLKSIRTEFGGPKHQLREMLNAWLTTGDNPSWRTLIDALRSRMVGASQLAAFLEAKYCQVIMGDDEAQEIVDQALASGSLKQRNTIAVIVGIMGSGKTWLIHRLFRINPPARYTSTGLAEKSFRGLMHRIANMDSWELLSQEDILEFLAPLLKAGLTNVDIVSLAKTFTEAEASQATVSPAENSTEVPQPTVSSAKTFTKDVPQPTAAAVPSPSHSHATVTQPQPEKSYANEVMINLVQKVKGLEKTFIVEFLHMVDTGGQPEFIEIMPSLIHNSNLTVLVLNLAQSLDEYPPIDFHVDGTAFKRPLPSVLTNRQVIHQFARTLQAKRPTHTESQRSMVIVIGTHRDCVKGKLSETLAAVNKELKSIFLPTMENELIVYHSHDEIIFPVDLLKPDDSDKKILEQIRLKISDANIVEEAKIPRIPLSFFMFEQDSIKYAEQKKREGRPVMVLSFDECMQVGARVKMRREVVQAALIYFHRHNIFLYFQEVLPNLVFLAPQVPLDFVNAIVAFSYKVKSGALPALKAKYVRFCNEGIITEEMLCDHKCLSSCFVPGIYESQHAIKLFRHIYTIAELTNDEPLATSQQIVTHSSRPEQKSSTRSREYLMMSLLADKKDIQDHLPSPSKVAPLVIHFSSGCVPNGCFGNVISCLISKYSWKVCQTEQGKPACLAHNIVTLRDPMLPVTITIVNHIQHLEIHVNMAKVEEHFSEICSSIQTTIFSAIKNVFKVMKFEDIQVEPAFLCPCKCSPSHAATVCHFLYGGSYTVCIKTGISIGCLQKEQQFWFQGTKVVQQQTVTLPQLICFKTRCSSINVLEQIGTHYWKLGVLLLEDAAGEVTQAIIEQHHLDVTKINLQIFQKWIQGKGKLPVEWSTLVEVLKDIGLVQLANEIEQNLK